MDKRTNEQKKEQANTITVIDGDPVIGTGRMVFKVEFTCYHGDEGTDRWRYGYNAVHVAEKWYTKSSQYLG